MSTYNSLPSKEKSSINTFLLCEENGYDAYTIKILYHNI